MEVEMSFVCGDCKREIPEMESSRYGRNLPDPLCQNCMCDLLDGKWIVETWQEEKDRPKTKEEKLLLKIFGSKDGRVRRTGSSEANILAFLERKQENMRNV